MNLKDVKKLIKLVEDANITALSIEEDGKKIEVKKDSIHASAPSYLAPQPAPVMTAPVAAAPLAETPQAAPASVEPVNDSNLVAIKSPMVGTFYASSSPETPVYVKEGSSVKEGDVVCMVEAMKLFNEIESEVLGTIEKILVENASPVEYGQDLYLVRLS
ncbi:acetyl-CoA carboxylase biotin carboxyl carrier protein [bacterium]|jgi:acetyl-CoA carboxylase biotin carboxyl carrier protein|nr:acetyl-CoA carboxylase biotin carboxyl carrier protein [bacterium]